MALLLVASAIAGCAPGLAPSAEVTTLNLGWERYFRIDATQTPTPGGTEIWGYIHNLYGRPAVVQLLAQALDADSNVVAQRIAWVPGGVPTLSRAYFRIPPLPPAEQYRVTVWTFDIIDTFDRRLRF
jgi:hypothetical protein